MKAMAALLLASLTLSGHAVVVDWGKATDVNKAPTFMTYKSSVQDDGGQTVLQVSAVPVKGSRPKADASFVAYTGLPAGPVAADSAGISFEYRGDGSTHFGSVFVAANNELLNSFEAFFPLDSTQWRSMTLRWTDFIRNDLPWDKQARLSLAEVSPTPGEIKRVGFGRSNCNHRHQASTFRFSIRNIRIVDKLPEEPVPAYSKGLARTAGLIREKRPLNILLLGDSITDLGGARSHGWHCAQLLQKKWQLPPGKVANAGISGQTARFGTIVLPRSLRLMPHPDLVCILYGANDCKAATGQWNQSGFTEEVFARNLEALVDQVRRRTGGQADILLISGVPRLDKKGGVTTGEVERIADAVRKVARQKEAAFCDSLPAYLALTPALKNACYADTIHQNQHGQAFLGQLSFKTIEAAVE